MSRINNISELREEIARLQKVSGEQKELIKNDIKEIGESLKPSNLFFSLLSSVTGIQFNKKEFFKGGIAVGISLLLQRYIFKEGKVYEWIDSIVAKIKGFINRHTDSIERSEEQTEEVADGK